MSSESNGRKPESPEGGAAPPAAKASARVASAWGPSRSALAAVHNLEALLRSSSVDRKTILDLVPELRSSASVLHGVVEGARDGEPTKERVAVYGKARAGELDLLLDAVEDGTIGRQDLVARAHGLTDELEGVIDLLALLDLAAAPIATEVSLDFVAREVGRMSGTARGREIVLHFDEANPDCAVVVDPYVLGALLALVVACAHAAHPDTLVLRARSAEQPCFIVEPASAADAALPTLAIRVMPCVEPSQAAAQRVAEQLGGRLELGGGRALLFVGSSAVA